MTEQQREALKELAAAYEQQRERNPLKDHETIAVYYGALRKLVDAR